MPTSAESPPLLSLIEQSLDDDQAIDTSIIDLQGKTSIADHMVVASGRSHRHVGAMTEHLVRRLKTEGFGPISVEGQTHCDWVLIDAGDVLVHLFRPEVRDFYKLEKLWGQVPPDSVHRISGSAG
ncbi:MAG: ribosome silencing factor [Alphaproteobacteria bacterium]|nr:ribosome silencing factor [Alphaproteobacteria bacterium]